MNEICTTSLVILILLVPYISGVSIFRNDGRIHCDGIVCPWNSITCRVSQNTFDDLSIYKYTRTCYDSSGKVTESVEQTLSNPNPGTSMNMVSTVGRGGTLISNGDTLSDSQREALEKALRDQQNDWSKWSKDFSENLHSTFSNGFPFN